MNEKLYNSFKDGVNTIIESMSWYNNSVKKYTEVIESKLIGLVSKCLENQQMLETKLQESANKIEPLQEVDVSLRNLERKANGKESFFELWSENSPFLIFNL